jgi:hypothetical protein
MTSDPAYVPTGDGGSYPLAGACFGKTSTTLRSESYDLSSPTVTSVTLEFDLRVSSNNPFTVSVTSGAGDVQLGSWTNFNDHLLLDVTPYAVGNATFEVLFDFQNATIPDFVSIDNFEIRTFNDVTCATAPAGPPSVPSDSLLIGRSDPDREMLDVGWDASSCPATNYNLLYGDLANVANYVFSDAECAIGTTGSYAWASPAGNTLFFLMVGTDGAGKESSLGWTDAWVERNGTAPSGLCGVTVKEPLNVCD